MATISEALGAHAAPREISLGGRLYRFGLITQRVKSEYERFLTGAAMQAITDFREILGEDGYAKSLDGIRRDIASGVFSWNGPTFAASLGTVRGVSQLLASVSFDVSAGRPCTADEIVSLTVEHDVELKHLFQTILEESFPQKKTTKAAPVESQQAQPSHRTRGRSTPGSPASRTNSRSGRSQS